MADSGTSSIWGRGAAGGAASFQTAEAALWGASERPAPEEAPGGALVLRHRGSRRQFQPAGLAAHARLEAAPAAPVVGGAPARVGAPAIVRALVVHGHEARAQPRRRPGAPRGERGGLRAEADRDEAARELDGLDLAELAERQPDRALAHALGHAGEAEAAVEALGPRRHLLDLQHRRADGGGVHVGHHGQRAPEARLVSVVVEEVRGAMQAQVQGGAGFFVVVR